MWNASSGTPFFFSPLFYLPITASFYLIMWLRKCSLKIWQWQMSNYRSYIGVSRLWPAWPSISPADAECETRALSLSTQPPWKVACSVLARHPSAFPLDCRSCVTVPLADHWPRWGHTGGWSNLSGTGDKQSRGTKNPPLSLQRWHLNRYDSFHAGPQRHLGCSPCFS